MNLVVKEPKSRSRKVLRWSAGNAVDWSMVLDSVEKEFAIRREFIQLSLNNGRTFIEAEPAKLVSDIGIVHGDILTLVTFEPREQTTQDTTTNNGPEISCQVVDKVETKDSLPRIPVLEPMMLDPVVPVSSPLVNRYMKRPFLLQEVTTTSEELPPPLAQLLSDNPTDRPADRLVLALHTVLLESGFVFGTSSAETLRLEQIGSTAGQYKIRYTHALHRESTVAIACVVMGNQIVIHGIVTPSANLSLCLPIQRYCSPAGLVKAQLPALSRQFKDEFVIPLTLAVKEALNLESLPPLLELPHEITIVILSKLGYRSVCRLGQTCRQLSLIYQDNNVWKRLYVRRFGAVNAAHPSHCEDPKYWYNQFRKQPSLRYGYPARQFYPYPGIASDNHHHHQFSCPVHDDPANRGIAHPYARRMVRDEAELSNYMSHVIKPRLGHSIRFF